MADPRCPDLFFPLPPADELSGIDAGAPHRPLCEQAGAEKLAALFADLVCRKPGGSGAETFGRYLFAVLLGDQLWQAILQAAAAGPIELALCWGAGDLSLSRLPWELIHGPDLFLVQERNLSLVRCVGGAPQPVAPIELTRPLHAIMVIGADLNSELARGAAEYLGMLWDSSALRNGIGHQMLYQPTPEALRAAVERHPPSVVHLICPIGLANGAPRVALSGSQAPDIGVTDLLKALCGPEGGKPPPIVVLSTGCAPDADGAPQPAVPLAAALVQEGVPVVVGLSGAITDQSCRIIARRFYDALYEVGPLQLPDVLARARRAGLPDADVERALPAIVHQDKAPWTRIDWGLPFLVMPDTLPSLTVAAPAVQAAAPQAQAYIEAKLPLLGYPVLCGRTEHLAKYYLLMADGEYQRIANNKRELQAIVVSDDESTEAANAKFGRSRLLQEFAAEAARAGHIPLLISPHFPELSGRPWAMQPWALARCLQDVAYYTGRSLGVPMAMPLTRDLAGMAERREVALTAALAAEPEINNLYNNDPSARDVLSAAFRLDLRRLLDQFGRGPDPFASLKRGLLAMRARIPVTMDSPAARSLLVYENRLLVNITQARDFGDTPALSNERNQIVYDLNVLALAELGQPFNDLAALIPSASRRRVLLLIDDVHSLADAVDFLFDDLLSSETLDDLREDLRVVLTYSSRQGQGNPAIVHRALKWLQEFPRADSAMVGLFREHIEVRMVYDQLFLHWRNQETKQRISLIPSDDPRQATGLEWLYSKLALEVRRIPSRLGSDRVAGIVDSMVEPPPADGAVSPGNETFWALQRVDDESALARALA